MSTAKIIVTCYYPEIDVMVDIDWPGAADVSFDLTYASALELIEKLKIACDKCEVEKKALEKYFNKES